MTSAPLVMGFEEEEEEEGDGEAVNGVDGEPLDGLFSKEFRGLFHCFTGASDGESYRTRDP